jgi:hypothetical protein
MASFSSERYETHSISQESASEHHHHSLDELTDEQIQTQIEDIM